MSQADPDDQSILLEFLTITVEAGAEGLEIEYEDGYEIISALKGNTGFGIGQLSSDSPQAEKLVEELWKIRGKKKPVEIAGGEYIIKVQTFDSFGETAYRVSIRKS